MSAISDGWSVVTLGEVCKFKGGNGFREELQRQNSGDYPFIKVSDMELPENKRFIVEANNWIDEQTRKREAFTIFPKNSIIFAKVGAALLLNRRRILSRETCIDNNMMAAVPNSIEYSFLFYVLSGINFGDFVQSGAVPSINQSQMSGIQFYLPPKSGQTKIAEILSTVDRAIEQTEALIAKQQRIKTGLMQDLLTRGIDEHGNPRSEQTHQFRDSPLGRIPVEWEVGELESVAEFVTSGSRGWAQYYSADGAIFLRIGNLTRNHINLRFEDIVFVNPPKISEGKRTAVLIGDLLISITADLGIIGVIPEGFDEGYVNQHIALVRLSPDKVNSRFIGWFLSGRGGQTQFEKLNESGAKAGLNLPTIRKLLIPITVQVEQEKIAEIFDTNSKMIKDFFLKLQKLLSLKTALMQDLLTGKKRVLSLLEAEGLVP